VITDLPLTVRYALAASICLARHSGPRRSARTIAKTTGIPPAFLAKILRSLARAGLIEGERGHHGGYRLARASSEITLADVIAAVDPQSVGGNFCAMGDRACDPDEPCPMHELWSVATAPIDQLIHMVTLDRLARG